MYSIKAYEVQNASNLGPTIYPFYKIFFLIIGTIRFASCVYLQCVYLVLRQILNKSTLEM